MPDQSASPDDTCRGYLYIERSGNGRSEFDTVYPENSCSSGSQYCEMKVASLKADTIYFSFSSDSDSVK